MDFKTDNRPDLDALATNLLRQSSLNLEDDWRIAVGQEVQVAADIATTLNEVQNPCDDGADDIVPAERSKLRKRGSSCTAANSKDLQQYQDQKSTIQVRLQGKLQTFTSFGGRALTIAGTLGNAALPVFIILDIVQGEWKAAAWAVGATVAGIAANVLASTGVGLLGASALAGPVGLFVGAVAGILFAILPGLFKKKHEPLATNTTQILQWAFFGDATHTGNEKCNQALEDNGQAPNCTASYGPGTLSVRILQNPTPDCGILFAC